MKKKTRIENFSIEDLRVIKKEISASKSKEELTLKLNNIIKAKEEERAKSFNENHTLKELGIFHPREQAIMDANGIVTLADLLKRDPITYVSSQSSSYEDIMFARSFYDMDSFFAEVNGSKSTAHKKKKKSI